MAPPLGAEGALCDGSAPSNRECFYRENVVGGRLRAPSNDDKSVFPTTKSSSKKSLQGRPYGALLALVSPLYDFLNTLLSADTSCCSAVFGIARRDSYFDAADSEK